MKNRLFMSLIFTFTLVAHNALAQNFSLEASGSNLSFNKNDNYLSLYLTNLSPQEVGETKLWERIFGVKANYGLVYLTVEEGGDTRTVPLYSIEKTDVDVYDVKGVGANAASGWKYPIILNHAYDAKTPLKIQVNMHYWTTDKNINVARTLIESSGILNMLQVADTGSNVLNVADSIVGLISTLWPSTNNKKTSTISFDEVNLNKDTLQIKRPDNNGQEQPFITLSLAATDRHVSDDSFGSFVDDNFEPELKRWTSMISTADTAAAISGSIETVVSLVEGMSFYIAGKPWLFADKVAFTANAIRKWAPNSTSGVGAPGGETTRYRIGQFNKLLTGDWGTLRRVSSITFAGAEGCETDECIATATFIQTSMIGSQSRAKAADDFLADNVVLSVHGNKKNLSIQDFKSGKFIFMSSGYLDKQKAGPISWIMKFNKERGGLSFKYDGQSFFDQTVHIHIAKVGARYVISRIDIKT